MIGPRLGAHLSIAGGITRAIDRAEATGCESLQIFTKNSNQWRGRPLDDKDIAEFRARITRLNLSTVSHASYLINLAAPDKTLREKSIAALEDELARGDQLGLAGVVLHPGAYTTSTETELTVALRRGWNFQNQLDHEKYSFDNYTSKIDK